MPVPFIDLKRDVQAHRDEYLSATARVLDSGGFSLGPEVEAFEKKFAEFLGVKHVVGVNGGTWALYAAFLALGIGAGDEVIVPTNSFIATAEAVVLTGAIPVFCDMDPKTYLLDLAHAKKLLTSRTKAIVPVHLYGQTAPMDQVMQFAQRHRLYVVEDAAQAHGARFQGKRAGSFGLFGCFSFYPTKNLGCMGEGGAVSTNDDELAETVRQIRCHGMSSITNYQHAIFGVNLKMEALQAAYLSLKLGRLDAVSEARRQAVARYRRGLEGLPLRFPEDVGDRHVYHLCVIQTDRRDELKEYLKSKGIGTAIHYPGPIHLAPSFARYRVPAGACPVAEAASKNILSLPLFSGIRDDEVDEVIDAIRAFFA